jgi:hypothetical protein
MTRAERAQRNLARAVGLDARRLERGRYEITGGSAPHVVDIRERSCDCTDFAVHGGACKHLLRALMAVGDPFTLSALRSLVPEPKRGRGQKRPGQTFDPGISGNLALVDHQTLTGRSP